MLNHKAFPESGRRALSTRYGVAGPDVFASMWLHSAVELSRVRHVPSCTELAGSALAGCFGAEGS